VAVVQYTFTHKQYIKQTIHRTTKQSGRVWAVPLLGELYPGICLTTEENHGKTSVRVAASKDT